MSLETGNPCHGDTTHCCSGGIIRLSDLVLTMLVPGWKHFNETNTFDGVWNLYDLKNNRFNDNWVNQSFAPDIYTTYLDATDGIQYAASAWYDGGSVSKTFGAFSANFTRKAYVMTFSSSFPRYWPGSCNAFSNLTAPYYFEKIFLVTDGTCGSACSYFISKLQKEGGATVMTYGGSQLASLYPDISSFAGGNVVQYAQLAQIVAESGEPLPPIPSNAVLTFNFHEMFMIGSSVPREFQRFQGDYHSFLYSPLTTINPGAT